ncbi:MAG: ATP-binding protein [Methanotrichaceae archaeon]
MKYKSSSDPDNNNSRRPAGDHSKCVSEDDAASADALALVHKMQIHQIELEMQNEELRRAKLEINNALAKYSDLYDFAPIGLFTLDESREILEVNVAGAELLGMKKDSLLSRRFELFIAVADRQSFITFCKSAFETSARQTCELSLLRDEAPAIYACIEGMATGVRTPDRRQLRIAVMDITERKRAEEVLRLSEEALSESEKRFRDAIDNFPNVFVIYDEDRRVRFVNLKGLQILRLSEKDVVGRKDEEIFPPDMINSYLPALIRAVETKTPQTLERTRPKRMGGQAIMINIIPLLDGRGKIRRILGITHDITKRKRAEDALRRARDELEMRVDERTAELIKINEDLKRAKEAAEAADVAKSQFLATMSHELRTPLNAIIGMTSLLLNEGLPQEQMESIEIIKTSGEALLALINKILDFSKMEKGKVELERQPFGLRRCIEDSIYLLIGEAASKELKLSYLIDKSVPEIVVGDQVRLRQILGNLLSNAIRFTDKGEVTISVSSRLKMWDLYEFHFSVRDTGVGIPQDMMYKLFKPFSQVDASNTRKYGGTGIGLAICKNLVDMMGGKIWAESELGKGSIFHFTILVQAFSNGDVDTQESDAQKSDMRDLDLQKSSPKSDDRRSDLGRNLRILLAEDNLLNQKVTMRMLQRLGYHADAVADGQEAVSAIERLHYDVVLMDMQMPEMDGLEATRIIRQRFGVGRQPKIIALTAHALEGDREKCIESGMDDYIAKPVNIEELKAALQRCKRSD